MASSLQDKAVWNNDEAMALINYLCEHKAEGGGNGGFKDVSFNGAAECIATHWTSGPVKTAKHCKTKWTSLKGIYRAIITFKENSSGMHWDNERGANIEGVAADSTFNNYVNASKSNKIMIPFRNKGWPYFEKMVEIMPDASARGGHAFSAMRTAAPSAFDQTVDLGESNEVTVEAVSLLTQQVGALAGISGTVGEPTVPDPERMDIDNAGGSSAVASTASGKRKLDALAVADSSADRPTSSNPTTIVDPAISEPARKKNSRGSSSLTSSIVQSSSATPPSALTSSRKTRPQPSSSRRTSTKLSPTLLVHEMQGTIGSLATAMRDAGSSDPVAQLRKEAVHQVSLRDDGLSPEEKLDVIELLTKDYASVQAYLGLLEFDEIRKPWLQKQLQQFRQMDE